MKLKKKLKVDELFVDGERTVRVSFGHFSFVFLFLIVWLSFWTVGIVMIAHDLITKPFAWKTLFVLLAFSVFYVFVGFILLYILFGRTVITLSSSGGTVFNGIGRIGSMREFSFFKGCEIVKDEYSTAGGKGGIHHYQRISVKSKFDLDGPREIFSSEDYALVDEIYDIVVSVSSCKGTVQGEDPPPLDIDAQEAEDRRLLASPPPKHLSVTRDFEGRIHVVYRRIGWIGGIINILGIALFSSVLFLMRDKEGMLRLFIGWTICMLFPLFAGIHSFFGKKTMTLDHGQGEVFSGIGGIGFHKRFRYGGPYDVRLGHADKWNGSQRMKEISIVKPGGMATKICGWWPNEVKPYLAALLRRPDASFFTNPPRARPAARPN